MRTGVDQRRWRSTARPAIAWPVYGPDLAPGRPCLVNSDGSINRSKGISSVTKPTVGKYCVELEDKDLDLTKLVPVGTLQYSSFECGIRISYWPHPDCGGRADTIHVITGMPNKWVDQAFGIVVP